MGILKKIFCETKMTWKLVICYAVITGVTVGLLNCIPALEDTSFTYPAVTFEYWFVAAIFVIMNCESAKEAAIKTFVFFLISQPIIYIVEVPFVSMGWEILGYYKNWIIPTILTLPGGWIAYQVKRDNILSAAILSVATGFLLLTGLVGIKNLLTKFPYGLISVIFCIFFAFAFIFMLLNTKKTRILAIILTLVLSVPLSVLLITRDSSGDFSYGYELDNNHTWTVLQADVETRIEEGTLIVHSTTKGVFYVTIQNEVGEEVVLEVTLLSGQYGVKPVE